MVRRATRGDLADIFKLWRSNRQDAKLVLDQKSLERELGDSLPWEDPVFAVFVYEEANSILGWCSLCQMRKNPLRKYSFAEMSLYLQDYNSTEVYEELIKAAELHIHASPIEYVLSCGPDGKSLFSPIIEHFGFTDSMILPQHEDDNRFPLHRLYLKHYGV